MCRAESIPRVPISCSVCVCVCVRCTGRAPVPRIHARVYTAGTVEYTRLYSTAGRVLSSEALVERDHTAYHSTAARSLYSSRRMPLVTVVLLALLSISLSMLQSLCESHEPLSRGGMTALIDMHGRQKETNGATSAGTRERKL